MLVYRMPNLMAIDGIPVSEEERTKAELYFLEQQPASVTGPPGLETGALPGTRALSNDSLVFPRRSTKLLSKQQSAYSFLKFSIDSLLNQLK